MSLRIRNKWVPIVKQVTAISTWFRLLKFKFELGTNRVLKVSNALTSEIVFAIFFYPVLIPCVRKNW